MTTDQVTVFLEELARLTDAVKRLGALAQQPVQPQSSVEIARNSKGATFAVKVYAPDAADASTLAQALYDQLAERFGQPAENAA